MSKEPLATWNDDSSSHTDLVWWARLDKRYQVEVQRTSEYTADLCIFDLQQDMRLILDESTSLSYGAIFGPDVSDIATWQERCLQVVDSATKGEIQ